MNGKIISVEKTDIVGGNRRDSKFASEFTGMINPSRFTRTSCSLQLQIKAITEGLTPLLGKRAMQVRAFLLGSQPSLTADPTGQNQ